ncbi:MAG: hypothetical protein CMK83_01395 [Pseudomonadales bacterium]|nr:hypothetical protein [Pseudomonadales bacterium]
MSDAGSSVTLIFYRMSDRWWTEPVLNLLAAACQMSALTHVEIALGEAAGSNNTMTNVCRIFNDRVGAVRDARGATRARFRNPALRPRFCGIAQELVERTGRNPQYEYIQLGCSERAVQRMLRYAKSCVGRPFSQMGMARSILWPRQTDSKSFFCAELVAALLKEGGLMEQSSNPGGATPEILYRLYKGRAAVVGNPCVLRDIQQQGTAMHFASLGGAEQSQERRDEREALLQRQAVMAPMQSSAGLAPSHAIPRSCATYATCTPRYGGGSGPPVAVNTTAFRQIGGVPRQPVASANRAAPAVAATGGLALTFNGLTMSGTPPSVHRRN